MVDRNTLAMQQYADELHEFSQHVRNCCMGLYEDMTKINVIMDDQTALVALKELAECVDNIYAVVTPAEDTSRNLVRSRTLLDAARRVF